MHARALSRPRTRSEWAEFYLNWYYEVKGKRPRGVNGGRGVSATESAVGDDTVDSEKAKCDGEETVEENSSSDEDYEGSDNELFTSGDDSEDSYSGNYSSVKMVKSNFMVKNEKKQKNHIDGDENGESPGVFPSTRISGRKETRGYTNEDIVIISEDDEIVDAKHEGKDKKKRGALAESNHESADKASKSEGSTDLPRIRKKADDNGNGSGLKKRRTCSGLGNGDGSHDKGEIRRENPSHSCKDHKYQRNERDLEDIDFPVSEKGCFDPLGDINDIGTLWKKYLMKKMKLSKNKMWQGQNYDTKLKFFLLKSLKNPILDHGGLPLKFRFEEEVQPPPAKSEREMEIDSIFCDFELDLRASEIDITASSSVKKEDSESSGSDHSPAVFCRQGKHSLILDEQIGYICEHCSEVILRIKHVLPDFHILHPRRRNRAIVDKNTCSIFSQSWYQDDAGGSPDCINHVEGTVWDLIAGVEKDMYPHQRKAFEFMWNNLAGDIWIDKLKQQPLSSEGRGCIISHAPGTGKTRLTIMFLLSFLKLYPTCRPVIIAPRGMLLTWEAEFDKWQVKVPFRNLNAKELSGDENALAVNIMGENGGRVMSRDNIRLLKLYLWKRGGSILGMSYQLFEKLGGENRKGSIECIRESLLYSPDLLVLDEGHTPRSKVSRVWNALMKVATHRRIILSGTPFQNNLMELYNTLCLVNPKSVNQIGPWHDLSCWPRRDEARKGWTSSIGRDDNDRLMKLKEMLVPFIDVYKGNILEERLPGLSECLVILHPTEKQKILLEIASQEQLFIRVQSVSLVSVHPSLVMKMSRFSMYKSELESIENNVNAGVKANFVVQLIRLADALKERVLVFSLFIDPLIYLKKQIISCFSWIEGREVLYMDGQLDEKQRQESILSFNSEKSEAKVLFASERACSEGISLVGASRLVLLDTVWNPSVEKQAISRAYRLGQKKVVYVYRLFTFGTEVRQYAQQIKKQRISQLIVSPIDGETCQHKRSTVVPEDKVLDAMRCTETLGQIIAKVIHHPKESDLIEIFDLMDQKQTS
ncbi:SNF2 domain-containing protein CLASSY 3-like [Andrographis paniculata]|uniref:SNF2 domain-containing protein CLASSY 3-like n=1 Tax=Andrographis paniculata TaxID=175694 RepID=UPI0021E80132|nr:SNF2 domain-containing protein CLASSY 3-like [Andrographis paniculata]